MDPHVERTFGLFAKRMLMLCRVNSSIHSTRLLDAFDPFNPDEVFIYIYSFCKHPLQIQRHVRINTPL